MNRDFKGVWADANMWLTEGLKCQTRCFLLEIDSLDKGAGCWAKNQHFARLFGMSKNRVSEVIKDLALKGYISISYTTQDDGEEVRYLKVTWAVEKSTGQSKNRQGQSKNRQGQSKNRLHNNRTEKYIERYSESSVRAYDFLLENCPGRLEQEFLIKYKSQLKDFERFVESFNDKVDVEQLPFKDTVLLARLCSYARNWLVNQKKDVEKEPPSSNIPKTFRG